MLNKYERIEIYFYNGKEIYSTKQKYCWHENPDWILTHKSPKVKTIKLTWDNVDKEYSNLKSAPFYIKNTKKGRKFKTYWDVADAHPEARLKFKEWRDDFEITVMITYKLVVPKLREIIDSWPTDYAIDYLKDRGIGLHSLGDKRDVN